MRGGMEAVYDDIPGRPGFGQFAPLRPAVGAMFSARTPANLGGDPGVPVVPEADIDGVDGG